MNMDDAFCKGCWRSREEIAAWGMANDATRLEILGKLNERREAAGGRRRRETRRRSK